MNVNYIVDEYKYTGYENEQNEKINKKDLVLVDNKICFQGGRAENADFIYLDVSKAFDMNDIPWTDTSNSSGSSARAIDALTQECNSMCRFKRYK
ncbi:17726_t:CDS:2 [Entrophospora sp. SA101]|nr:15547_t:CDS:2 [Entrophospora sp. SA101]CAJ0768185.1 17726_t:CDS:2 [Entrophospora sp. SA101]